jgi:hypothetical protein
LNREWNGPDDATAINFLRKQGYRRTRGWHWRLPKPDHVPTEKELRAIQFLIEEWDWGGIEDKRDKA